MRSFEEIPDIADRIKRSKMELQESGFYWAPEWDSQSCCDQDYVNNFKKGWESRQTEVDELQKRVNACQKLLEKWKTTGLNGTSDYAVGGAHARQNCEDELEQALKGGGDE